MSSTVSAMQRCPRCGNENRGDSYACSFCGKRLRTERIENISIFKRYEEEWYSPARWYLKILWILIKPNKGFFEINHRRKDAPGFIILLFNSLLWGLMGLAILVHFPALTLLSLTMGLSFFLAFFLLGTIFQFVFYTFLIWLFTRGANIAVDFSERLESRFGMEAVEKEKYKEESLSPFSIYRGGTLLQAQESYKYKMMLCAFAPYLIVNVVKILILLIGLPFGTIDPEASVDTPIQVLMSSPVWAVIDVIDGLTLAIWVPILMAIAIRELSNSSTFRVLISSVIIGIFAAVILFFLRPTLFGALFPVTTPSVTP